MKSQRAATFLIGTFFGLFMVATCANTKSDYVNSVDLGHPSSMTDLSSLTLTDSSALAGAPASIEVDCDKSSTITYSGSSVISQTQYWADVNIPGFDPTAGHTINVVICGLICSGQGCMSNGCGDATDCTSSGSIMPELDCHSASYSMSAGRIVVYCGLNDGSFTQYRSRAYVSIQ